MTEMVSIADVRVEGRHRTVLGDLHDLATSIVMVGLLHPIVIGQDRRLIAGQRRLEACRMIGWTEIPATVVTNLSDARALLTAERDENTCRKEMTPSEKVSLGRALEPFVKERARERKAEGQRRGGEARELEDNLSASTSEKPHFRQVRDEIGDAVGMSGMTYQRARAVVLAAENGVEGAAAARAHMDTTGKVLSAFNSIAQHINLVPVKRRSTTTGKKRPGPAVSPDKQKDNFFRAFGAITEACFSAPLVDVPQLSKEQAQELGNEMDRARRAIRVFHNKIMEAAR